MHDDQPQTVVRDGGSLTADEILIACRNIGIDLRCGGCAEAFYTGYSQPDHDEHCAVYQDGEDVSRLPRTQPRQRKREGEERCLPEAAS